MVGAAVAQGAGKHLAGHARTGDVADSLRIGQPLGAAPRRCSGRAAPGPNATTTARTSGRCGQPGRASPRALPRWRTPGKPWKRRGQRGRCAPPADIALLAAAKPEPVEIEEEEVIEEEHTDEDERVVYDDCHIRAVLLALAADWRAKAQQARTRADDLTPFNASHKLHGQADLLKMCADKLVATLNGHSQEDAR